MKRRNFLSSMSVPFLTPMVVAAKGFVLQNNPKNTPYSVMKTIFGEETRLFKRVCSVLPEKIKSHDLRDPKEYCDRYEEQDATVHLELSAYWTYSLLKISDVDSKTVRRLWSYMSDKLVVLYDYGKEERFFSENLKNLQHSRKSLCQHLDEMGV